MLLPNLVAQERLEDGAALVVQLGVLRPLLGAQRHGRMKAPRSKKDDSGWT